MFRHSRSCCCFFALLVFSACSSKHADVVNMPQMSTTSYVTAAMPSESEILDTTYNASEEVGVDAQTVITESVTSTTTMSEIAADVTEITTTAETSRLPKLTTTTRLAGEPIVKYDDQDGVYDGFETAYADNIDFMVIKLNDDCYGIYTLNGLQLNCVHIVDKGFELLGIYDFKEAPVMICNGSVSFLSGGIAGYNRVPSILMIDGRRPANIQSVMECGWIPEYDNTVRYHNGIWHTAKDGKEYIISSVYGKYFEKYFVVVSDDAIVIQADWDAVKDMCL